MQCHFRSIHSPPCYNHSHGALLFFIVLYLFFISALSTSTRRGDFFIVIRHHFVNDDFLGLCELDPM